jgi:hypothetical protein
VVARRRHDPEGHHAAALIGAGSAMAIAVVALTAPRRDGHRRRAAQPTWP